MGSIIKVSEKKLIGKPDEYAFRQVDFNGGFLEINFSGITGKEICMARCITGSLSFRLAFYPQGNISFGELKSLIVNSGSLSLYERGVVTFETTETNAAEVFSIVEDEQEILLFKLRIGFDIRPYIGFIRALDEEIKNNL